MNESAPKGCSRRGLLAEVGTRVRIPPATGELWYPVLWQRDEGASGPAGVGVDGALVKGSSESLEGLAGRLGAPRTAKAQDISGSAVKFLCARETGGWGRLSDEGRDRRTRLERGPLGQRGETSRMAARYAAGRLGHRAHEHGLTDAQRADANRGDTGACRERLKPEEPTEGAVRRPALEPYWGKPTVRNLRGDDGNVGIIRSPLRAIALPDPTRPRSSVVQPFGPHSFLPSASRLNSIVRRAIPLSRGRTVIRLSC